MRHNILPTIALSLMLLTVPANRAFGARASMTAAELVAQGQAIDAETVTFEGEAIGDVLRADAEHRWVNVLSGGVGVGVWMSAEDADLVENLGSYHQRGDTLRATGTFNFACDRHGGDLDVHATQVEVVSSGTPIDRTVHPLKLALSAALAIGAAIQYYYYRRARQRE